jgi:hypothetical protein
MIYFVVLLIITIIFLSLIILSLKSKETFILDEASNKPQIDSYQLNNYNYLTEVKKFEIIPGEKEIQLGGENMYLGVRASEGWELFKKENLSDGKVKYYWRKKIIQN